MYIKVSDKYILSVWKNGVYGIRSNSVYREFYKIAEKQYQVLTSGEGYQGGDKYTDALINSGVLIKCEKYETPQIHNYDNIYFDTVIFSITGRCNYKCLHCSVNSGKESYEMSFEKIEGVLSEIKKCGLDNIVLIGGEPLVRNDLFEIIEKIISFGMTVSSIYTNGSLITDAFLDRLESYVIKPMFQMSFDGVGYHDKMRGVKGAEKRFFKTLKLLRSRDYSVHCYMSMTAESISALRDTINVFASSGVSSFTVYPPLECGRWKDADKNIRADFSVIMDEYIKLSEEYISSDKSMNLELYRIIYIRGYDHKYKLIPKSSVIKGNFDIPVCRTFGRELNISPEGYLSPCYALMESDFVKNNMPDIFHTPLEKAISDSEFTHCMGKKVFDIMKDDPKCKICVYKNECGGGCRSSALLSGDGFFSHDPVMCMIFENGYYKKLKSAASWGYTAYLNKNAKEK